MNKVQNSKEWENLVKKMKQYIKNEGIDLFQTALAETLKPINQERFEKEYKAKRTNLIRDEAKFHNEKVKTFGNFPGRNRPMSTCFQHSNYWKTETDNIIMTAEPFEFEYQDIKNMIQYCEQNNIICEIIPSYEIYFPGKTVPILYTKKDI